MLVEKQRISGEQLAFMVGAQLMGNVLLIDPASYAGHLGWVVSLTGGLYALFLCWIYNSLSGKFPGISPTDYAVILFGDFLGKAVILSHFVLFMLSAMVSFNDFLAFTNLGMPETPKIVIIICQAVVVMIALYLGLESIARTTVFIIVFSILSFVLSTVLALKDMDFMLLLPLATDRPQEFWQSLFTVIGWPFNQLVLFLWFIPLVNNPKEAKKGLLRGVLLGSSIVFFASLRNICIFGDGVTNQLFPAISFARNISIGANVMRVEIITSLTLNFIGFVSTTLFLYASVLCIAQMFNLRSHRTLILPLFVVVVLITSRLPLNIALLSWAERHFIRYFLFIMGFVLPVIGVIRSFFVKEKQGPAKKNRSTKARR